MSELPGMWEEADLSGGWADTDGMSARDWLYARLTGALIDPELVSAQLDAYTHELAEKIRAASITGDTNWDAVTWTRGMERAADLIDPQKEGQ